MAVSSVHQQVVISLSCLHRFLHRRRPSRPRKLYCWPRVRPLGSSTRSSAVRLQSYDIHHAVSACFLHPDPHTPLDVNVLVLQGGRRCSSSWSRWVGRQQCSAGTAAAPGGSQLLPVQLSCCGGTGRLPHIRRQELQLAHDCAVPEGMWLLLFGCLPHFPCSLLILLSLT